MQDMLGERVGLEACYLKVLAKGKALSAEQGGTLASIGLKNGSKLMLMMTDEYHQDKELLVTLRALGEEVSALEVRATGGGSSGSSSSSSGGGGGGGAAEEMTARDRVILEEQLTGLLERIDGVETLGRPSLRATRKKLVQRCQQASALNTQLLERVRGSSSSGGGGGGGGGGGSGGGAQGAAAAGVPSGGARGGRSFI